MASVDGIALFFFPLSRFYAGGGGHKKRGPIFFPSAPPLPKWLLERKKEPNALPRPLSTLSSSSAFLARGKEPPKT